MLVCFATEWVIAIRSFVRRTSWGSTPSWSRRVVSRLNGSGAVWTSRDSVDYRSRSCREAASGSWCRPAVAVCSGAAGFRRVAVTLNAWTFDTAAVAGRIRRLLNVLTSTCRRCWTCRCCAGTPTSLGTPSAVAFVARNCWTQYSVPWVTTCAVVFFLHAVVCAVIFLSSWINLAVIWTTAYLRPDCHWYGRDFPLFCAVA